MNKRLKPASDARLSALRALGEVLDEQRSLSEVTAFNALQDDRTRGFSRRLSYGVLRWLSALEALADMLIERPLRQKDRDVRRLVLLGLYQLWKEDTADHAAVHATAEAARALRKPWAVGLINAVLRRFQRDQAELLSELAQKDARFAHPAWLLSRLRSEWPDQWESICAANNAEPPFWLRLRPEQDPGLREQLSQAGFHCDENPQAPWAIALSPAAPVANVPGFAEGKLSVQDAAAQLAAPLLSLEPHMKVLDACAAPGGKTCHILETCPTASVLALDITQQRLALVRENLERLGLEASLVAADALAVDQWWDGQAFDRILLDAPCTATGVIRRHPEIKWLRTPEQEENAIALQKRLLDALWPLLKAGGMLVYATCSVLPSENSRQIRAFLERHDNARLADSQGDFGRNAEPGRQILPGENGMDGFYYAVIEKPADSADDA